MRSVFRELSLCVAIVTGGLIVGYSLAHAAEIAVDQINQKFSVSSMTLKVGDTVHYKNGDDVTHNVNVTDPDGNNEDKGLQKPGETISQTYTKPGEYDVRCSIHPKMHMKVSVS
jgi:plastocyanin